MAYPLIDLTGKRFGRLLVIGRLQQDKERGRVIVRWECDCDCGNVCFPRSSSLRDGSTASCGCFRAERYARDNKTLGTIHGHAPNGHPSPTYQSWVAMKNRCMCPTYRRYSDYGGRGIKVCEQWMDFANFLADMGERPLGTSIDRYPDNNGNYEPGNCRWATSSQQASNKRPRSPNRTKVSGGL